MPCRRAAGATSTDVTPAHSPSTDTRPMPIGSSSRRSVTKPTRSGPVRIATCASGSSPSRSCISDSQLSDGTGARSAPRSSRGGTSASTRSIGAACTIVTCSRRQPSSAIAWLAGSASGSWSNGGSPRSAYQEATRRSASGSGTPGSPDAIAELARPVMPPCARSAQSPSISWSRGGQPAQQMRCMSSGETAGTSQPRRGVAGGTTFAAVTSAVARDTTSPCARTSSVSGVTPSR